jgi:hypothetical protein
MPAQRSPIQVRLADRRKVMVLRRLNLVSLKKRALRHASSAASASNDVRVSHGFIPADVQVEVLGWPKL